MASVQENALPPNWSPNWPPPAEELYVLDPHGDVLLKLVRQPEDDSSESSASSVSDPPSPPNEEAPIPEGEPNSGDAIEIQDIIPDADLQNGEEETPSEADATSVEYLIDVHIRVSSRHLILASPTFRSMLGPDFEEGQSLQKSGYADLALGDDDPDAMLILLQIIHFQIRKVPRHVDIDTLTKLSVLIDYYHMHEVMELFSDMWVENLAKEGLPMVHGAEAMRWLWISWVFGKGREFRAVSRVIEQGCDETLEEDVDEMLPIPGVIISK